MPRAGLGLQQIHAHVRDGQVVGRVVRLLPDERGTGGVGNDHTGEVGADPLRGPLDANTPPGWGLSSHVATTQPSAAAIPSRAGKADQTLNPRARSCSRPSSVIR